MANSVTAVFWTIFEVFRRPNLLSRVRSIPNAAVEASREESESKILGDDPQLQSIFAEVTRLRVVGIIPRYTVGSDFQLGEWSIPEGSFLGLPFRAGAFNEDIWNAVSDDDPHPLNTFWADRFLIYPNHPGSGPLRKDKRPSEVSLSRTREDMTNEPRISLKGRKDV